MSNPNNTSKIDEIDMNNPDFFETVQNETESDKAKLKKTLEVVCNLRIEAAELEAETASLYHADLWHAIEDLKTAAEENSTAPPLSSSPK